MTTELDDWYTFESAGILSLALSETAIGHTTQLVVTFAASSNSIPDPPFSGLSELKQSGPVTEILHELWQ
jgi:hypothetical protein